GCSSTRERAARSLAVRPPAHCLANCARQRGLSRSIFDAKHMAMRALLGIAELHSVSASIMQAERRSAVASSWADATVGSAATSTPAAASKQLRIVAMTISLGGTRLRSDAHGRVCRPAVEKKL